MFYKFWVILGFVVFFSFLSFKKEIITAVHSGIHMVAANAIKWLATFTAMYLNVSQNASISS